MKRFIMVITLCVMTFWTSTSLRAGDFGIVGGASFTGIREVSRDLATGYHAGITYKFRLPVGFAIQPSLLYHVKGSVVEAAVAGDSNLDLQMGYAELPVSFQWGPDLIFFRPFLDVTPFVGYSLTNKYSGISSQTGVLTEVINDWDGLNRLEYGLGLGVGLELWKFQVIARYNWNFGQFYDAEGNMAGFSDFVDNARQIDLGASNFGGFTLSLAVLF